MMLSELEERIIKVTKSERTMNDGTGSEEAND